MKFVLLFWMVTTGSPLTPNTTQFGDGMACVLGLRTMQRQFEDMRGMCVPYAYKSDKQYNYDVKDTNATIPQ